jgi:hypothetical protein
MAVTPNYSWPVPVNTDYVKDGADAIKDLGDAIDATVFGLPSGALALVKSQTIGTAVSSVEVTGAFNATYDAYKIFISGGVASTNNQLNFIFTGSTANYAYSYQTLTYTGTADSGWSNSFSSFPQTGGGSTDTIDFACEVFDPFLTKFSRFQQAISNGIDGGRHSGQHKVATSFSGFTLTTTSGTLTGGTIYIYGYAKV